MTTVSYFRQQEDLASENSTSGNMDSEILAEIPDSKEKYKERNKF